MFDFIINEKFFNLCILNFVELLFNIVKIQLDRFS